MLMMLNAKMDKNNIEYDFEWEGKLTDEMKSSFTENGFFIVRNFLDSEEVTNIWKVVEKPDGILNHGYVTYEENGNKIQSTLCSYPGYDVTGMVARSEKVAGSCEQLLACEVYHWCSMFMNKEAYVGGEHVWHQDYGYWYNDGVLYPDMITVWMALDKCRKDNSCKQVLRSSNKMGRVDHFKVPSGQMGVDPERVKEIMKKCEHIYLEMDPGDAFFHHGNTLHRSDENKSKNGRLGFMSCFNGAHNSPVFKTGYPSYNKLEKVPNEAIKQCTNYTDFSGKGFRDEV
ncbi:uncharacterized protein LOC123556321 isoform X1 [Mercenaria mercenaria]|uniref:uncharacterized protein LOC123556321 isoform X1 n=2 Tax=Mercenaria mercenaria TaxID=6596 RepID=UPI001E1D6733|nr:uncharacterized protein LOC123556321 isoform X1 [Mercenaria mercenaria]